MSVSTQSFTNSGVSTNLVASANAMRIPTEDLKRQWARIGPEILDAVNRVLPTGKYVLGSELTQFEADFAAFCGTAFSIGMSNGTAALHLALRACGVGERDDDEVITVPNTFAATAFAISHCGAMPVFADVDPDTFNLNPATLEALITPRTRAIVPVHLYGQVGDMDAVMAIARKHGLRVVEDCAHTHGATRNGKQAGSFGDVGCFSFYPTKVMGAFGDGGMCVTSDPELNAKIRQYRYMGQKVKYNHEILGYQERLDELQAAMLAVKLRYLPEWVQQRQRVAAIYDALLAGTPVTSPPVAAGNSHAYYLYTIQAPEREALIAHLAARGIGSYVVYPYLVPMMGAYSRLRFDVNTTPVARDQASRILSLPMFPELTDAEAREVGEAVRGFYRV
jgi:dTDP-4-amino-4,6-dideoxygalactose transaminase